MPKFFSHGKPSYKSNTHSHKPHHGQPPRQNSKHPLGSTDPRQLQLFDFLIVVDFECTCERDRPSYPNEIIEFPAILVDVRRGVVDKASSFQSYVKPWRNPTLSAFCTELTGIRQSQVDNAPDLPTVIKNFIAWFTATIPLGAKCVFATDGPWDFKNFLFNMAVLRDNVAFPTIFYEYFDIRTTFARFFNKGDPIKLDAMMKRMKIRFDGRPHCGFDDAYNIARLALRMMEEGCVFQFLISIPLTEDTNHYELPGYPLYRRESGSGYIEREHVEERAKAVFGQAYFDFSEQQLTIVASPLKPTGGQYHYLDEEKERRRSLAFKKRMTVILKNIVAPVVCCLIALALFYVFILPRLDISVGLK